MTPKPHSDPVALAIAWRDRLASRSHVAATRPEAVQPKHLIGLLEQLETLRNDAPTILWIIEELYSGGSWHNMEKRREGINEALARYTEFASNPANVVEQPVTPGKEERLPSTAGDLPPSNPASEQKP